MPDFASPNTGNYSIPKGNLWFTPDGGTRTHMGNAPSAEFTMEVEKAIHYSAMAGIRTQDFTAIVGKTASLAITLEEATVKNMQLLLLGGDTETDTEGNTTFEIGSETAITGKLEIIGSGDIGPKYTAEFYNVTITPAGAIPFIGDAEVMQFELEAECNAVGGSFGKMTLQDSATA